jgi:PAS domain S-box-containing protein
MQETTQLNYQVLKKILDHSHDEIYVTNAQGIVLYVNQAVEKHCGIRASDIIGKSSNELSECHYWFPRVSPIALEEKKSITLEQKTQTGKTLLTTATPIFDKNGNLEYIIENARDITEATGIKLEFAKSQKLLNRYQMEIEVFRRKEMNIPDFISRSQEMSNLLDLIHRISQVDSTVLLLGESGSGKSHMAKHIHKNSPRQDGPFIVVNCASIPSELMESEMFGYSKGAFTGANVKGNIGLIELASDGTLFLDEIAELPLRMQAKLLQVLHENQYFKVGGREIQQVNCRIIAATNRNLHEMVRQGQFREDLYYRLNVFEIEIPPLRERKEEIVLLALYFLDKFNQKYKCERRLSERVIDLFLQYSWPGNARELENMIERLVVVNKDNLIDDFDLPKGFNSIQCSKPEIPVTPNLTPITNRTPSLEDAVNEVEKKLILQAYQELGTSYEVAKTLKISQSKASRLIRKYLPATQNKLMLNQI